MRSSEIRSILRKGATPERDTRRIHQLARALARERLHLVEYGFVGFFLYRALRLDIGRNRAYAVSFCLTVVIGIGDELIQLMLPQRFFEIKDVQLNAFSAGLGLMLWRVVERNR